MEDKEISFINFINDTWVRSFEHKEWVWRFSPHEISHGWNHAQISEMRTLFENIKRYLSSRVMIIDANGKHAIDRIEFHVKYGWIVGTTETKAYLGKVIIPEDMPIEIGKQSYLSGVARLRGPQPLSIGAFTVIADGLYLNTSVDMHPTEYASMINFASEQRCHEMGLKMEMTFQQFEEKKIGIEIGNDVWIGRDVRVFHGASIANGCVIAERSLVRGPTEPYGIYAGLPAKLKSFRFNEKTISTLLDVKWWNWGTERLVRNQEFFGTNLKKFDGDIMTIIKD